MKEIGGYFGLDQFINNEYHKGLIALNTGRNALMYLIKAKKIKKLYIPYYLCNSIRDTLKKNGCDFEYYHIDDRFNPVFDNKLQESFANTKARDEYIYVVNYFGQLTKDKVALLKKKYNRIILDNTQAFYQRPLKGVDTIYSCRKFFGIPDGAYLSTDAILDEELEGDISKNRMTHILGRYEGKASDYYNDFRTNDESLRMAPLMQMSKLTKNILGAIDYERARIIRNKNYAYLDNKLGEINALKLSRQDGAFSYPFYIENGLEIRKKLLENRIYIPILWPNVLEDMTENSIEYKYAANILPLPCDQRYAIEDMEYLLDVLMAVLNIEFNE